MNFIAISKLSIIIYFSLGVVSAWVFLRTDHIKRERKAVRNTFVLSAADEWNARS